MWSVLKWAEYKRIVKRVRYAGFMFEKNSVNQSFEKGLSTARCEKAESG